LIANYLSNDKKATSSSNISEKNLVKAKNVKRNSKSLSSVSKPKVKIMIDEVTKDLEPILDDFDKLMGKT
jgi:hypothetical protein